MGRPRGCVWIAVAVGVVAATVLGGLLYFALISKGQP